MSNTLTNLYDRQSSLALTSYPFAIVLGLGGIGLEQMTEEVSGIKQKSMKITIISF